jgi:RHS repeat-associated protein
VWQEDSLDSLDKVELLFTGKQVDAETGWYNFGARYLDPKTGIWLSSDPALGEYIPRAPLTKEDKEANGKLPGNGGIYNPVNFALYHFAGNNPIRYTDPDGRETTSYSLGKYDVAPYYKQDFTSGWDYPVAILSTINNVAAHAINGMFNLAGGTDDAAKSVGLDLMALGVAGKELEAIAKVGPALRGIIGALGSSKFDPVAAITKAALGKGNFGIGVANRAQADALGKAFVGDGYREMSGGKGLVSKDGLRTYRFPSEKDTPYSGTGVQANFERKDSQGNVISNGHLDVTD